MDKVLIITGGSKGIGQGIVKAYAEQGFRVFSMSRTVNAAHSAAGVTQFSLDLTTTAQIETVFQDIFALLLPEQTAKITLVNNAGTLGQIGPLHQLDAIAVETAIKLNVTAPLICSAAFLRNTHGWQAQKSIINITSGAASKPYYGWSVYGSSKAALDMMTRTLAVEQADAPHGAKVFGISPGVVDTDMQAAIRNSTKSNFKDIDRFLELKTNDLLNDAKSVGQYVYQIDHDNSLPNGTIVRMPGKN